MDENRDIEFADWEKALVIVAVACKPQEVNLDVALAKLAEWPRERAGAAFEEARKRGLIGPMVQPHGNGPAHGTTS